MARSQANRGKYFEEWIDMANAVYHTRGMAVINKIPTPWKVQRKYSPYNKTYEIAYAFAESKSTVDFGGTAQKHSVWFDAKVTKQKCSFPLKNIHKHQIDYLKDVHKQGGKAFFLMHSEILQKTWLLWIDDLIAFMNTYDRKSIPFDWLDEYCKIIEMRNGCLDYLPIVLEG
jgi:recombination protein U